MLYNLFENRDFVSVFAVALLAEGVDRNLWTKPPGGSALVALLAEGVDRNSFDQYNTLRKPVALLAEGVDRNPLWSGKRCHTARSPSSRRAWIEIIMCFSQSSTLDVALLAEGVDRNS